MIFNPFPQQAEFLLDDVRIKGAFAGKRGGKTEVGALNGVLYTHEQRKWKPNKRDPYTGIILAPTGDMLRRLSMAKFLQFAAPFDYHYNKSLQEIHWGNGSVVYGISSEKPQRMEGIKANWAWADEGFQMTKQVLLEMMARVSDQQGDVWITGSLGVQYLNPKAHFLYQMFKERPLEGSKCYEWGTAENPYYPQDELIRLKDTLDPTTFRQMFEICWDVSNNAAVYDQFDESNLVKGYQYNKDLETNVAIDWGWTHEMAAGFFQYDPKTDTVYLFDEIVASKITRETLYNRIMQKPYKLKNWYCDIAGKQTREDSGKSNIKWFEGKGVHFKYRKMNIVDGIVMLRQYICDGKGRRRFYIDELRCPKSVDQMRNYRYQEKQGILEENPLKRDDDCPDMIRYYFVNRHDDARNRPIYTEMNRWSMFNNATNITHI